MELSDLSKDIRRLLLAHWTEQELSSHLHEPEYFFDQIVNPRLDYLRRNGETAPTLRLIRTPNGESRVLLLPSK